MTTTARHPLIARGAVVTGAVALAFGLPTAAQAHVTASASDSAAGAYTVLTFSDPHGCDGSPTTKIAIEIPDEINAVTPTRNAFYQVDKVMEDLKKPIEDAHGNKVTERVKQVVYTADTPLPADQRDTFELSLQLPEEAAGKDLYFPTVQTCEKGETSWTQIPAEGQDAHDLESPSPVVSVTEAESEGHEHGHEHGGDAASEPADGAGTEAQAQGASEDSSGNGSTGLSITALVIGALGLITGGAALLTSRKRS